MESLLSGWERRREYSIPQTELIHCDEKGDPFYSELVPRVRNFKFVIAGGLRSMGENDLERERQELNLLPAHRVRGRYKEVEVQAPFLLNLSDNSTYCRLSVHARTVWAWPHVTNH